MTNTVTVKTKKTPSQYAEALASDFTLSSQKADVASLGQYFTPQIVAKLIAENFSEVGAAKSIRILDPGAGIGILSCVLSEKICEWKQHPKEIEIIAYEIDKSLIPTLKESLSYLKEWIAKKNIALRFSVRDSDFILENVDIINQALQKNLFSTKDFEEFDLIIANPPYFKISKSDLSAKAANSIVHGQPNIYTLFMAISASLLKEKGQLAFITPRSYASGLYFKKFRQDFFSQITPTSIHLFESRNKAFNKDRVLQENVILHARKDSKLNWQEHKVQISTCDGLADISNLNTIEIPLAEVIILKGDFVLHIPTKITQREIVKMVKSWKHNLHSLGLEVSTGPVVPFRARNILKMESINNLSAPLLWLHNIKTMQVNWPIESRKPQYIRICQEARRLLVPNYNYVLVRRFSTKEEKKRLVAAPLISKILKSELVGIENHINYIYRKSGELSEIEALGLAAILNCSLLDSYFRTFNGNTQVSATELRSIPLPATHVIEKVGAIIKGNSIDQEKMDEKVINLIKQYA